MEIDSLIQFRSAKSNDKLLETPWGSQFQERKIRGEVVGNAAGLLPRVTSCPGSGSICSADVFPDFLPMPTFLFMLVPLGIIRDKIDYHLEKTKLVPPLIVAQNEIR